MNSLCQVGFSEGNIRALCDVGRTTKKHTVGYIGQKGIGFKSVFKITDAPQIHSRGFHVAFDLMQHSALGYVLPTWVDDALDISSVSKLGSHQTSTKVLLPFKKVCLCAFADESCNTIKAASHVILAGWPNALVCAVASLNGASMLCCCAARGALLISELCMFINVMQTLLLYTILHIEV